MIGALAHLLAVFALINLSSSAFSGRGKDVGSFVFAAGLVVGAALLGATWVVHPAAGLLLAFFGTTAFSHWRKHSDSLLVGMGAAFFLIWLGAQWLVFPLGIMAMIWFFGWISHPGQAAQGPRPVASSSPEALTEGQAHQPVSPMTIPEAERVPAARTNGDRAARSAVAAPATAPADALTTLHQDSRLPGAIRAQLVALDLRTQEVLNHLQSRPDHQAYYSARAIRNEYAPEAVAAYLKLPPTRADTTPIDGNKTGRDLLFEQLDLLLSATQDLLDQATQAGGQDLLTHRRFLEEKFGQGGRDLKID